MERTFQDMFTEVQNETGDFDAVKLTSIKGWLNRALTMEQSYLKILYTEEDRTLDSAANQDQYQKPEDAIRLLSIRYFDGTREIPLERVPDDERWRSLKLTTSTGLPRFWHPIGEDLYELYPKPAATQVGGIILTIKVRSKPMYANDYSTGTVSATTGSQAVVGVGTTFTAQMVGRKIKFSDGVGDGIWYRISAFTDPQNITIENKYRGLNVSGGAYIIGDIPRLNTELHQSLIDFAFWRYWLGKGNVMVSREYRSLVPEEMLTMSASDLNDDAEEQVFGPQPKIDILSGIMQVPQDIT